MTLDHIHALARRFDRRARLPLLLAPLALIAIAFIGGQQWQLTHDPLVRAMWAADTGGMLASFYLAARLLFPPRDPAEPAGVYLRRRLQRLLANVRGGWVIAVIPLLPGIVLGLYLTYGRDVPGAHVAPPWAKLLPLVVFAAAVVVFLIGIRSRGRVVRAQLDEVTRLLNG